MILKHRRLLSIFIVATCFIAAYGAPPRSWQRTTALPDSLWLVSDWISVAGAPVVEGKIEGTNERAADGASWFVSNIKNQGKVVSAKWMTSALGVYDLYVNGQLIGNEILKPGFTHPEKTRRSYTYDVTGIISPKQGDLNNFSAQVTPGWWADKIVTPGGREGMLGRKTAFRGIIELTYEDGTKSYHGTKTDSWKAGIAGAVKHAAIFDGESYDAREIPGFRSPAKMKVPEINEEFKGEIVPAFGADVYFRDDLALSPVNAYIWEKAEGASENEFGTVSVTRKYEPGKEMLLKPGEHLVIDFGQNCAAVPDFIFKAEPGTNLKFLPAEILNDGNGAKSRGMDGPEGSIHRQNLRIPDSGMMLDYTFAGNGKWEQYRPRATFFGYRYASISADKEVKIKSIASIPVTSISAELETGKLVTGNTDVNNLVSNSIWGQRSNYLSVPTDCPQRNERLGWTADTQVFSETGTFFANTRDFFHKWMRDMRDTQTGTGAFPGVAPFAQYGAGATDMMRLGWADAGIIVPWVVWKQYGDTNIVDENWEAMEKFMNHVNDTKYDHQALSAENGNFQWADWLSYEPLESNSGRIYMKNEQGHTVLRPEAIDYWNYLCASYWLMDSRMMRDMAAATGRDSAKYQRMADTAKNYILDRFLTPDGKFKTGILNTMQTPALFALHNKLLDGEAKKNLIQNLRDNFKSHDNCLQTGFLGTSILMPTLTENGMTDIAYELLFQRKNPSWLYSIDNGATTIWERWNSYMLDKGMGPQGMNSFNHYAYGCVCEWIWETIAGIASDPSDPGFKTIIMKPVPDKRIGFIDAWLPVGNGEIKSSWRYKDNNWTWEFTVPEGSRAIVTLPGETESKEYAPGFYKIERNL